MASDSPSAAMPAQQWGDRRGQDHHCMVYVPGRCELRGCGAQMSRGGGHLKKCVGCDMAFYCCEEHQKEDWAHHQVECNKLQELGLWGCGFNETHELARFPLGSQGPVACEGKDLDWHTPGPEDSCGICGSKTNLERTECCGNWICNTEEDYEMFSYSRAFCIRSHRSYTLCGHHCNEEHAGDDWRECEECNNDLDICARSWYSTNGYNFTPGLFSAYPAGSQITVECAGCEARIATGFEGYSCSGQGLECHDCSMEQLARLRYRQTAF